MESKAQYALIGTMVIIFIIAALSAVLWLSGSNLDQEFDEYVVTFDGPIRGVQEAAEVRFNGIKVGEVTTIRLDPDDPNKVRVSIAVFVETPVDTASYAQLEPQGLTGLNIIQLFSGGSEYPLLKDVPESRPPYMIAGRESQLDSLLTGGGTILQSAELALKRVTDAMDEPAIEDFKAILSNIEAITREYRDNPVTAARIEQTLANIDQASLDVSTASLSVDETALETRLLIQEHVTPILEKVSLTVDEVNVTLSEAQTLLTTSTSAAATAEGAVIEFQAGTLRELEVASANLSELLVTLTQLADQIERNPSALILGEKREVLELPQ